MCTGEMRQEEYLDRHEPVETDIHEFSQSGEDSDVDASAPTHAITKAKESHEQIATSTLTDSSTHNVRVLLPAKSFSPSNRHAELLTGDTARAEGRQAGIVMDASREVQLRLLVGRTGSKHGSLPIMVRAPYFLAWCADTYTQASLGIIWFIPCFEEKQGHTSGTLVVPAKEIDFLKPASGIERVEIDWEAAREA